MELEVSISWLQDLTIRPYPSQINPTHIFVSYLKLKVAYT
jgi:hypothetical protein